MLLECLRRAVCSTGCALPLLPLRMQVGDSAAVTVIEPSDIEDLLVCLKCGQPVTTKRGSL